MADDTVLRVCGERTGLRGVSIGGNLRPDDALGVAFDTGTVATIKAALWNVVVGRSLGNSEATQVDAIAGLRFGRLELSAGRSRTTSTSVPGRRH